MACLCIVRIVLSIVLPLVAMQPVLADSAQWRREGWTKTDFSKTTVDLRDIQSGGPPRDGIPPIDAPGFVPIASETTLDARDPVITIELAGVARAYPLRILLWHEIVNDRISEVPLAVTYCPLCNTAIVFDRRLGDVTLDFGTTGKLRNSDLVMYDRQTDSWWQQFTGEGIVGHYAGATLRLVPSRLEDFASFTARAPHGEVLVPTDPHARRYGTSPYPGYDTAPEPFLYRGGLPLGIEPMDHVVIVRRVDAAPLIIKLSVLREARRVTAGTYHISWRPGQLSVLDDRDIGRSRDVGTVEVVVFAPDGSTALSPHDVTFAFAAYAFHPNVTITRTAADLAAIGARIP
jgi:hypothetical protein